MPQPPGDRMVASPEGHLDSPTLHQSSADGLSVRIRRTDSYAFVTLQGDLDVRSTAILTDKLRALETDEPDVIVLDLRELRFLDSTGIALTLQANARAREAGRRLVLIPGPPAVQRPFELAALESVLEFRADGERLEEELDAR